MVSKFTEEPRAVNIRPAIAADREAITRLERAAKGYTGEEAQYQSGEQQWLLSAGELDVVTIVLIAEVETLPVGYVTGIVINEGSWIRGYVCSLYVEDKYRRKRAAVHMMDEIILKMREFGARVFFTNSVRNSAAFLKLSEKGNFIKLTAKEFYDLVMPEQNSSREGAI